MGVINEVVDLMQEHPDLNFSVEGHTDSDPMSGNGLIRDNLDLSAIRATNTFRALVAAQPDLLDFQNAPGNEASPILSVSGYGPSRPVAAESSEENKARNRRIDLRFLMAPPTDGGQGPLEPAISEASS